MSHNAITRRQAIKAGAAVASLPLFASPAAASDGEKPKAEPVIGIATQGFDNDTNRSLAEELAGAGIHVVQLFLNQTDSRYWKYNGRSDVSRLTAQRSKAIADAYRSAGVSIHSIGVYTNLIHPDQAEREANLAYFDAMMQVGDAMGVHTFITEAGHYHSSEPTPSVEYHFQEEVWYQMVATGKQLAEIAERRGATVLLEPFFRGFLASAKRTRLFLEAVGSPRIRALLDPANLLEVNDLEEMFDQLGPRIDCLHAKDRKLHVDRGVPAGQGDLDYPKFVALAAKRTPSAPLILEYVGRDSYKQALAHLRGAIRSA
ncbi:MAG: sugar phosphate isomerase/epimerase family protein [Thermoguttaceae bacterium]|jgi:sugar phosphate isomerase/epimerase